MHHLLEVLHISNTEPDHVLLELCLLIIDLVLRLNNFLSNGKFIGNGSLKSDVDVHWQLQIINVDVLILEPFINEVVENVSIE